MKEIYEFTINSDHAHLLLTKGEGKNIGGIARMIRITRDDPRFEKIGVLDKKLKKKDDGFLLGFDIIYEYTKTDWENADLFEMRASTAFEPAGEECGTVYDEKTACKICGTGAKRIGPLILKASSIPDVDFGCSIGGEYIVSEKFIKAFKKHKLKGSSFAEISFSRASTRKYYEIKLGSEPLHVSKKTLAGVDPFDFSESAEAKEFYIEGANYWMKAEKEIYKCPKGHLIGLNLLSEVYLRKKPTPGLSDIFTTREHVGLQVGLLRPEPIYLCSPALRNMVLHEKLKGFKFKIAHLEAK